MSKNRPKRESLGHEENFYDGMYSGVQKSPNWLQRWVADLRPTLPNIAATLLKATGEVEGKHVCEIGCGTGRFTGMLLEKGCFVSASDISSEGVEATRNRYADYVMQGRADIRQMNALNLSYSNESFDLVVGNLILHHIDLDQAAKEISRVLKPGGRAVFVEPLAYNPVSNLWRRLTPSERTVNEWPLSYSEIDDMGNYFTSTRHTEFGLLPLLSSFVYLFTHSTSLKYKAGRSLSALDPSFLRICKPLRRYCSSVLLEFTK